MKKVYKKLLFLSSLSCLSFSASAMIEDGDYRIICHTRNGGVRALEAFPNDDTVRPMEESWDQDQKWSVKSIGNGSYHITCHTKNGGVRYLEAFPNEDKIRPRADSRDQNQKWSIKPTHSGLYRIICKTKDDGKKALEAFPNTNLLFFLRNPEIKPRGKSLDQDQMWKFIPWKSKKKK